MAGPSLAHHLAIGTPPPRQQDVEPDWAAHFASVEEVLPVPIHATPQTQNEPMPASSTIKTDDLAGVAGLVIDSIKHETNPKFKESQFIGLMHWLHEWDVIIDRNDMVQKDMGALYVDGNGSLGWVNLTSLSTIQPISAPGTTEIKINDQAAELDIISIEPQPAVHPLGVPSLQHHKPAVKYNMTNLVGEYYCMAMDLNQHHQQHISLNSATASTHPPSQVSISSNQEYEELESPVILGKDYLLCDQSMNRAHIMEEWGKLQASWDKLDATATGLQSTGDVQASEASKPYIFQMGNPYLHSRIPTEQGLPYQVCLQNPCEKNPH